MPQESKLKPRVPGKVTLSLDKETWKRIRAKARAARMSASRFVEELEEKAS